MTSVTDRYRAARDQLLDLRGHHDEANASFAWPNLGGTFNWAIDWFDVIARGNDRPALIILEEDGTRAELTFDQMATAVNRIGNWRCSVSA